MGEELFARYPGLTATADAVLGYSIAELCVQDPERRLNLTQYTQPAIFVVNALSYKDLVERDGKPDVVAGHSLGEFNALVAAGAMDFETGLNLVRRRGELMGAARGGGMSAVIGLTVDTIEGLLREHGAAGLDMANYNSPFQTVLSGPVVDIERMKGPMEEAGAIVYHILPVSAAFHSRYMADAAAEFGRFLRRFRFSDLRLPVLANVTGRPYGQTEVAELLTRQIREPVQWDASMAFLRGVGVEQVTECGTGQVLTKIWRAILRDAEPLVPTPEDLAALVMRPSPVAHKRSVQVHTPPAPAAPARGHRLSHICAETLGSESFRRAYGVRLAYLAGAMFKGISSTDLVVRMGRAGLMAMLGTSGLTPARIETDIRAVQAQLTNGEAFGVNLMANWETPRLEAELVDLFLRCGVRTVEAAGYLSMTASLIRYRFHGAGHDADGVPRAQHRVIAKVTRPEVARAFLLPPPDRLLRKLLEEGALTQREVDAARALPVCSDLCVAADSGGQTDMGSPYCLLPTMLRLRDRITEERSYPERIHLGAAGGIGSPEAALAALVLGAEFLVTGSINQCTPEAGTSDVAKDLLQKANVQDTGYAPAESMFELGAKAQVLKKGVFFPARANKLFELYSQYESWEAIDAKTRSTIESRYFMRSAADVWRETQARLERDTPELLAAAEREPRQKLALLFRWYLGHAHRLAAQGSSKQKVDYQIYCGPAMGAFNEFVVGTSLENWRARHVDTIADHLMEATANLLRQRMSAWLIATNGVGDPIYPV